MTDQILAQKDKLKQAKEKLIGYLLQSNCGADVADLVATTIDAAFMLGEVCGERNILDKIKASK